MSPRSPRARRSTAAKCRTRLTVGVTVPGAAGVATTTAASDQPTAADETRPASAGTTAPAGSGMSERALPRTDTKSPRRLR